MAHPSSAAIESSRHFKQRRYSAMRILYLGDDNQFCTSAHRASALIRLGHEVVFLNPRAILPGWPIVGGISTRIGFWPFVPLVGASLRRKIGARVFDLAWVDGGSALSPGFHRFLLSHCSRIVNYNCDDPFGGRDHNKWNLYLRSVPYHDLTIVMRDLNIKEAQAAGAKRIARVYMSYDPVVHFPVDPNEIERSRLASEVVFIGAWMPERGSFLLRLIEEGVPLAIWGPRWQKAPEYARLRPAIRGSAMLGADYVKTIRCAKIALGMLSKGNRDEHTQRSVEIPFIGGAAFCAERTKEHEAMYSNESEAAFWSSPEECAAKCKELLGDSRKRKALVQKAHARVVALGLSNDDVMRALVEALGRTDRVLRWKIDHGKLFPMSPEEL